MVKLTSGREVELKPLKFFQRAEIKDIAFKNYQDKIPVSLALCGKCVIYSGIATEAELDAGKFTDEEIYEIGTKVFENLFISTLDKKK
jgi:hypothetical protein